MIVRDATIAVKGGGGKAQGRFILGSGDVSGGRGPSLIGNSGFGFIDNLNYAQSTDQLAWAVAHNISHELMHAFGVAVHHDQTGTYLDSATATWSLLIDPNTTFSPAAVQDILSNLAQAHSNGASRPARSYWGSPPCPTSPAASAPSAGEATNSSASLPLPPPPFPSPPPGPSGVSYQP